MLKFCTFVIRKLKLTLILSIFLFTNAYSQWDKKNFTENPEMCFSHDGNSIIYSYQSYIDNQKLNFIGYYDLFDFKKDIIYQHEYEFYKLAMSNNGKYLASLDNSNILRIFLKTGFIKQLELKSTLPAGSNQMLLFSSDDKSLIHCNFPYMIKVSVETGIIEYSSENIISISRNGDYAAIKMADSTGILNVQMNTIDTLGINSKSMNYLNTSISNDGSLILYTQAISNKMFVNIYNINEKKTTKTFPIEAETAMDLRISDNNKIIFILANNNILKFYDADKGIIKDSLFWQNHYDTYNLIFTGNYERFAYTILRNYGCPNDMPVIVENTLIIELEGKRILRNLPDGHLGRINYLTIDINNTMVASGGNDKITYLWDFESGNALGIIQDIGLMEFTKDGKYLVIAGNNNLKIWNTSDYTLFKTIELNVNGINSFIQHPDKQILVCGTKYKIIYFSTPDFQIIKSIDKELIPIRFSKHRDKLICIYNDSVFLYNSETGEFINSFSVNVNSAGKFKLIDVSPDLKYVSGLTSLTQFGGDCEVWDLTISKLVLQASLTAQDMKFLPDSRFIATHTMDFVSHHHGINAIKLNNKEYTCTSKYGSWEGFDGMEVYPVRYSSDGYYYCLGWCNGNVSLEKFCNSLHLPVDDLIPGITTSGINISEVDNNIRITINNENSLSNKYFVDLFDIFGKSVKPSLNLSFEGDMVIIDINKFSISNGMYFLTFQNSNISKTIKFLNYH